MASGSFALDLRPNGFGLISLSHYAEAIFVDPEFDSLHVVLLENTEPTHVSLPVASTAPAASGTKIYEFNADEASNMVFSWRGRLNLMPKPTALRCARVFCESYANIVYRFYGSGTLLKTKLLANSRKFKLPVKKDYETYEVEFIGTSTVRTDIAAERDEEIA